MSLVKLVHSTMLKREIPSLLALSKKIKLAYGSVYSLMNGWHAPNSRTLPTWARFCGISRERALMLLERDTFGKQPKPKPKRAKRKAAATRAKPAPKRTTIHKPAAKRPARPRSKPSPALQPKEVLDFSRAAVRQEGGSGIA